MWTHTFCFYLVKSQIRKGHVVNVSWLTFIRDCVNVFSEGVGQITTSVVGCFKSSLALLKEKGKKRKKEKKGPCGSF